MAQEEKTFVLVNRSWDRWAEGTQEIPPGGEVKLEEEALTIVFEPNGQGKVTAAPADQPQ